MVKLSSKTSKKALIEMAIESSSKAAAVTVKKAEAKVKSDHKFYKKVLEVIAYEKKFGNMMVPTKGHSLSIFVSETRRTAREIYQGKIPGGCVKLDKTRIEKLNEIGFHWGTKLPKEFPEDRMP